MINPIEPRDSSNVPPVSNIEVTRQGRFQWIKNAASWVISNIFSSTDSQTVQAASSLQGRILLGSPQENNPKVDPLTQELEGLYINYNLKENDPKLIAWIDEFNHRITNGHLEHLSISQLIHLYILLQNSSHTMSLLNGRTISPLNTIIQELNPYISKEIRSSLDVFKTSYDYHDYYDFKDSLQQIGKLKESLQETGELSDLERKEILGHFIMIKRISVKNLNLSDDEWVQMAPFIRYLDLKGAPQNLTTKLLKSCQNINYLFINSPIIDKLPTLPKCTNLDCLGCMSLRELPALPVCTRLNCTRCISLRELPALPECTWLECDSCICLQTLPELPECTWLDCSSCTGLHTLPPLPQCMSLSCQGCTGLQTLPPLPQCDYLSCQSCTGLQTLPELPWDARVYSDQTPAMEFTKLEVDINDLAINPKKWLLELGRNYLLKKNRPFPNVYYFEDGRRNEAIDVGGVRRDFITRLCENIFKENDAEHLHFSVDAIVENSATAAKEIEDCYRTLGKLFALCYLANSYFKTGPFLSEEAYQCLTTPASFWQSPEEMDKWFLYGFLNLKLILPIEPYLIDTHLEIPADLPANVLEKLTYLANPEFDPNARDDPDKPNKNALLTVAQLREKREEIRANLLDQAKQEKRLTFLLDIAKSMRESLGENRWNELVAGGAKNLQSRIEGILTKEALLSKLRWIGNPLVDPQKYQKTQGYLRHWINNAESEQLRKFVRAVTSLNTLGPDNLKMEIFNRSSDFIPTAHTCDFTLELSCDYPTQEAFDKKLDMLLTEGLAGGGFQVA